MFFFFNDTATTEIYTLSLHDALPILPLIVCKPHHNLDGHNILNLAHDAVLGDFGSIDVSIAQKQDRKSTRLNSSHANISYAVFCLKKKNTSTHGQYAEQARDLKITRL